MIEIKLTCPSCRAVWPLGDERGCRPETCRALRAELGAPQEFLNDARLTRSPDLYLAPRDDPYGPGEFRRRLPDDDEYDDDDDARAPRRDATLADVGATAAVESRAAAVWRDFAPWAILALAVTPGPFLADDAWAVMHARSYAVKTIGVVTVATGLLPPYLSPTELRVMGNSVRGRLGGGRGMGDILPRAARRGYLIADGYGRSKRVGARADRKTLWIGTDQARGWAPTEIAAR